MRSIDKAIRSACLSIVCAGALSAHTQVADASPEVLATLSLPDTASLALVGANMLHNGSLMSIATFSSRKTTSDVLAFYRSEWHSDDEVPGFVENAMGGWSMISRLDAGINLVVQVRNDAQGYAQGLVSTLDTNSAAAAIQPSIEMPAGAELLSSTGSQDGARHANTWILRSHARPGEVAAFYKDHLQRAGWTVVSDRSLSTSAVLLLSNSQGSMEVTASADVEGTLVVVNRVRSGS